MDTNTTQHEFTNELIHETSPYLLQHAHNPVNWHPWDKKALELAQKEDKMLIISVGYAACHWCHVMEHESFEDSLVAKLMNDHFISIKVDREERPDVDQIYMNAAQLITGRGGWPLNAIAMPDGRPVYAGTYYPKDNWLKLLEHFIDLKATDPDQLASQAEQLTEGIQSTEMIQFAGDIPAFTKDQLDTAFDGWSQNLDFAKGGKKGAPKFPMPNNYQYLLDYHFSSGNETALKGVLKTLDEMAAGGIYDQIGGGFARYSVDADWHVPHFEKMLYDNGQLVSLYSDAYKLTKIERYREVVHQTLDFVERELMSKEGGFYSSLDADSEGEEGKFYVWSKVEIDQVLGEDSPLFCSYYDVSEKGNWEHKNVLRYLNPLSDVAKKHDIEETKAKKIIDQSVEKLLKERSTRIRPGLDDKILTSWNALMLKGYVDAYEAFGIESYKKTAINNGNFLKDKLLKDGYRLDRNYKNGVSSINAFLDDYALTIEAFISLYQITFDEEWITLADGLAKHAIEHFYDDKSKMFFYTSDLDEALIARKMETSDNVIPASTSSMAKSLFLLSKYLYNQDYKKMSEIMVGNMSKRALEGGQWYSNWLSVMHYFVNEPYEVAIVGENWNEILMSFQKNFQPNALYLGGANEGSLELLENKLIEGQTTIFVCQNRVCKFPVTEVGKALELMD